MSAQRSFRLASPNVVSETVEGEAVILNLDSGFYYGLDPLASLLWDALREGAPIGDLIDALATRFQTTPEATSRIVSDFADRLVEEQLLRPSEAQTTTFPLALPDSLPVTDLAVPSLTRYEDIQELLLIDPIHEVDEDGWPQRPPNPPVDGN